MAWTESEKAAFLNRMAEYWPRGARVFGGGLRGELLRGWMDRLGGYEVAAVLGVLNELRLGQEVEKMPELPAVVAKVAAGLRERTAREGGGYADPGVSASEFAAAEDWWRARLEGPRGEVYRKLLRKLGGEEQGKRG